jgi:hypothetical protein
MWAYTPVQISQEIESQRKERMMNRHVVFRILMALVLVGAVIGIGALAYNAGVTQGLALAAVAPAGEAAQAPLPVYLLPYGQPSVGLGGFGCFGALMVLFLLFLAFGAARAMLWPRRWGRHPMHHGPWGAAGTNGTRDWAHGAPPMFDEWHKRAHATPGDEPAKG